MLSGLLMGLRLLPHAVYQLLQLLEEMQVTCSVGQEGQRPRGPPARWRLWGRERKGGKKLLKRGKNLNGWARVLGSLQTFNKLLANSINEQINDDSFL